MENTTTFLVQYPEIIYGLCVNLLTWIVFKYITNSPKKGVQLIVLLTSGTLLAIIFSLITNVRWPMMILAFLASIGFYEVIIKFLMKKLNITYDKNKKQ